jgi:homoserine/homoserine lactone efflux protein
MLTRPDSMTGYSRFMLDLIAAPTLAAYIALVIAISVAPGPNVLFVMTQSAWRGWRAGMFAAAGIESANALYVLFSAIGLAGLIATSGAAFEIIKWAGAAYLAWLGFQTIRSSFREAPPAPETGSGASRRAFRDGFVVALGNPKTILFFLALFPQFIDPAKPTWLQSLVLGFVGIAIDFVVQVLYATAGGLLSKALSKRTVKRWFERTIGTAFMGLAVAAALVRRA